MAQPYAGTDVLVSAQALINDQAGNLLNATNAFPLLQLIVNEELNAILVENGVPIDDQFDNPQIINPPTNTTGDPYIDTGLIAYPTIPVNLIQPTRMWERQSGSQDLLVPMSQKSIPPHSSLQDMLRFWSWDGQNIYFIGATVPVQVLLQYKANMMFITAITNPIVLFDGKNYLSCKLAEYAARFLLENEARADKLKEYADAALDRLLRTAAHGRQGYGTRRKPFRVADPILRRFQ